MQPRPLVLGDGRVHRSFPYDLDRLLPHGRVAVLQRGQPFVDRLALDRRGAARGGLRWRRLPLRFVFPRRLSAGRRSGESGVADRPPGRGDRQDHDEGERRAMWIQGESLPMSIAVGLSELLRAFASGPGVRRSEIVSEREQATEAASGMANRSATVPAGGSLRYDSIRFMKARREDPYNMPSQANESCEPGGDRAVCRAGEVEMVVPPDDPDERAMRPRRAVAARRRGSPGEATSNG